MAYLDEGEILIFVCLSLIYSAISVFTSLRIIRIHKFSREWKQTTIFYLAVLLQGTFRVVFFTVILTTNDQIKGKTVYFLLSLPDSFFILSYILLYWQLLSVFYSSHADPEHIFSFISKHSNSKTSRRLQTIVIGTTTLWTISQSGLYALYYFDLLSSKVISREIGVINLCLPIVSLLALFYLHFRSSGIPI